jgi:transposase
MARPASTFVPRPRQKEIRRLEKALRESREPKFRDRCRAVLWSVDRRSIPEISALLGYHYTTIFGWFKDYRRFGIQGLYVGKSSGRPSQIDEDGEAALRQAVETNPRDLGYPFTRWTSSTLAEHLYRSVHVRVHPETVRRALKRLNYSYGRPKLSLKHKQNRRAVRATRRLRDTFLKKSPGTPTGTPSSFWTSASSTSTPSWVACGT